jgi:hypothetical protein
VIWFSGSLGNSPENMYVKINNTKIPYSGAAADLAVPWWRQWNVNLASLSASVLNNVTSLTIGFEKAGAVGGTGKVFFDDIRLYREAPALPLGLIWREAESADSIVAPTIIASTVAGASGGQYLTQTTGTANSTGSPPANGAGIATYKLNLTKGQYVVWGRYSINSATNGWWVRLNGATPSTAVEANGWARWSYKTATTATSPWRWDDIHSTTTSFATPTITWTVPADGTYNLEATYRVVGDLLDAWMIVKVGN